MEPPEPLPPGFGGLSLHVVRDGDRRSVSGTAGGKALSFEGGFCQVDLGLGVTVLAKAFAWAFAWAGWRSARGFLIVARASILAI